MAILNYNLSTNLQSLTQEISSLRDKIILAQIPPGIELRLRWEAKLAIIYWSLVLSNSSVSKADLAKLVAYPPKKRLTTFQKEVIGYKNALDYIKSEWLLSGKPVTLKTVKTLYDLALRPILGPGISDLEKRGKEVERLLEYLQTGSENPVIRAGICQIQFELISPFKSGNERIARFLSNIFLYKSGWDMRGMLVLEEFFRSDLIALRSAKENVLRNNNLTLWLEYYAYGIVAQLKKALKTIEEQKFKVELPTTFWKLNDRQKKIMIFLENPAQKITNKEVQKMCGVSQITASRDLSKLANLGFLFAHGKGRSVYYTKA